MINVPPVEGCNATSPSAVPKVERSSCANCDSNQSQGRRDIRRVLCTKDRQQAIFEVTRANYSQADYRTT